VISSTSNDSSNLVLVDSKDGYSIVTFNRPDKRNALSTALLVRLAEVLEQLKRDGARVVILTGAGDKAFTAGADLTEAKLENPPREFAHDGNQLYQVVEQVRRHPAIFIAAVNGLALGAGLTLTHNCELALASETAQFGMPEISFGVFPALAGPATLHRIASKHAAWMILTGARIDAATAENWGVVNEVHAADKLLARAEELAQRIAKFDAVALDYSKKALREAMTMEWSRAIEYGLNINAVIARQTRAGTQGISNFVAGGRSTGQGNAELPNSAK
jgi:enoyl-CoA hydratase/carnithine racemase